MILLQVEMRQEMTSMARVVQDLESQVAVSQDENSNLSTGLEELDIRHQQEIGNCKIKCYLPTYW